MGWGLAIWGTWADTPRTLLFSGIGHGQRLLGHHLGRAPTLDEPTPGPISTLSLAGSMKECTLGTCPSQLPLASARTQGRGLKGKDFLFFGSLPVAREGGMNSENTF